MILPTPVLGPVGIFINAHGFKINFTYMHNMSTYNYDITSMIYVYNMHICATFVILWKIQLKQENMLEFPYV